MNNTTAIFIFCLIALLTIAPTPASAAQQEMAQDGQDKAKYESALEVIRWSFFNNMFPWEKTDAAKQYETELFLRDINRRIVECQETGKLYDECMAQLHEAALRGRLPLIPWEAWFSGPKNRQNKPTPSDN